MITITTIIAVLSGYCAGYCVTQRQWGLAFALACICVLNAAEAGYRANLERQIQQYTQVAEVQP